MTRTERGKGGALGALQRSPADRLLSRAWHCRLEVGGDAAGARSMRTAPGARGARGRSAEAVVANEAAILEANAKDMAFGREKGLTPAMMDRRPWGVRRPRWSERHTRQERRHGAGSVGYGPARARVCRRSRRATTKNLFRGVVTHEF